MGLIEQYDKAIAALEAQAATLESHIKIQEANLEFNRARLAEIRGHIAALQEPREKLSELYPSSDIK